MIRIAKDLVSLVGSTIHNASLRAKNASRFLDRSSSIPMQTSGPHQTRSNPRHQIALEREDVNLATVVRIMSNALSQLPLEVKRIDVDDNGRQILVPEPDHEFYELWREPNYWNTTQEINAHVIASLMLTGSSKCIIQDRETGVLEANAKEIWPQTPGRVLVTKDKKGMPIGYVKDLGTQNEQRLKLDEVVHHRLYNLNDPLEGGSGLDPLNRQLQTDYLAELMDLSFFLHDGTPRSVLMPDSSITPEQREQIEEYYDARANPQDKHRLQIVPVAGKLQTITPSHTDMEFLEQRKYHQQKIFGLLQIPPTLGGVFEHANYANARVQEAGFWRNNAIPFALIMADFWTRQLFWALYGKDHILVYSTDNIDALKPDKVKRAARNKMLKTSGIITANEARADEGYEPHDDPNADELQGSQSVPVAGSDASTGDRDPALDKGRRRKCGNGLQYGDEVKVITRSALGRIISTKTVPADTHLDRWAAIQKYIDVGSPFYQAALRKFYKGQEKRTIEALRKTTTNGKFMSNLAAHVVHKDDMKDGHLDFFIDLANEDELMRQLMEPIIIEATRKVGTNESETAIGLGQSTVVGFIGLAFDVDNPAVKIMVEQLTNSIVGTNAKTFKEVRRILKQGFRDQLSVDEVAKLLRAKFTQFSTARAKTIARTEMGKAANAASHYSWTSNGATHKTWVATLDTVTRDWHVQYNGERVAIKDSFKFGPEPMAFPQDPNAQLAGNIINCRCALEYDYEPLTDLEISDLEAQGLATPNQ